MQQVKVGVLGSTRGSALRPIVAAWRKGELPIDLAVIVSNRKKAPILEFAREQEIPSRAIRPGDLTREEFDAAVTAELEKHQVELVLMLGYMRIVSPPFVERWRGRLVNIHPSLLPRHGGLMDLAVHESVLRAGDSESGCTIHLAEEEVDAGRVILQKKCPVAPDDTPETLKAKVQKLEGRAFVEFLKDPLSFLNS
ncbi:MAG: phosphoribosylglycinamide formyltransferase [Verrucomicrobiota bacterium]